MKMDTDEEIGLPPQEIRTSRDRRSGDIVPVPAASSSNDGPAVGLVVSPAAEMAIASTDHGGVTQIEDAVLGHPRILLSRIDDDVVLQPPLPKRNQGETSTQPTSTHMTYGSPPAAVRAQSSIIMADISDDDVGSDSSTKRKPNVSSAVKSAVRSAANVKCADRRKRGRPPTTGEWRDINKVKAEYIALKERELELDEIEYILDSSKPPKRTEAKRDLPKVGDLQRELTDLAHRNIQKRALSSLIYLDKLSDKSSGIDGKLIHELRIAARKLEASISELCDRADKRVDHKFEMANEYLVKKISRLEGELDVARSEIVSLRASLSPAGQSPPRKRVRNLGERTEKESGNLMEAEHGGSLHPSMVPLPDSLIAEKVMIDRGCSPIWDSNAPAAPLPAFRGGAGASGADVGTGSLEDRDLTALEQSLLDHIDALFAQKSSLQEDIGRIRKNFDQSRKEPSSSTAGRRRSVPETPAAGGRTKRKKKRKGKGAVMDATPARPRDLRAAAGAGVRMHEDPATPAPAGEPWTEVLGRRARRAARRECAQRTGLSPPILGDGARGGMDPRRRPDQLTDLKLPPAGGRKEGRRVPVTKPRPPTTAVVSVTIRPGTKLSYREVMTEARSKIDLVALGISDSRLKQAASGGILIEIPGKDRTTKADDLANRMDGIFKGKGVSIGRPSRTAEIRIRGIDVSVSANDIIDALVKTGGCAKEEIRIGQIRDNPFGQGSVWVKCPALAARKVTKAGSIRVGWGRVTVEPLRPRPLMCFRCLGQGHVRYQCKSEVDRGNRCYRCGAPGHRIGQCSAEPKCPLCVDLGRPAGHVLGERGCVPPTGATTGDSGARTRGSRMPPRTSLVESRPDDTDGTRADDDEADGSDKPLPRRARTSADGRTTGGNRKMQNVDEERMEVEPLATSTA